MSLSKTSAANEIFCVFCSVVNCCRKSMLTAASRNVFIIGCVESCSSFAECSRLAML